MFMNVVKLMSVELFWDARVEFSSVGLEVCVSGCAPELPASQDLKRPP